MSVTLKKIGKIWKHWYVTKGNLHSDPQMKLNRDNFLGNLL